MATEAEATATASPDTTETLPVTEAPPAKAVMEGNGRKFVRDKQLVRVGIAMFVFMMFSWSLQWVAYALPYWRGDVYHHGGFFEICGNRDLEYNHVSGMLESGKPTNWTCTSVDAYADKMALLYTNYPDRLAELLHAKYLIKVSTILEAASTGVDMLFGFSTIWAIMYPNANSRAQLHSIYFCVFGVLLAPALCIVDMVFQFHYWEVLGIGAFNYNSQSGFWFSGDVTIVATAVDVIVSLWFMDWGVKREARLRKEQQEAESKGESEAATIEGATNGHEMVRKV